MLSWFETRNFLWHFGYCLFFCTDSVWLNWAHWHTSYLTGQSCEIGYIAILYDGSQIQYSSSRKPSYSNKYRSQALSLGYKVVLLWCLFLAKVIALCWSSAGIFVWHKGQDLYLPSFSRLYTHTRWYWCLQRSSRSDFFGPSIGSRQRTHTSPSAAKGLSCLPPTSKALTANSVTRTLSDPEGSPGPWASLLSKSEVSPFCVPRRATWICGYGEDVMW